MGRKQAGVSDTRKQNLPLADEMRGLGDRKTPGGPRSWSRGRKCVAGCHSAGTPRVR